MLPYPSGLPLSPTDLGTKENWTLQITVRTLVTVLRFVAKHAVQQTHNTSRYRDVVHSTYSLLYNFCATCRLTSWLITNQQIVSVEYGLIRTSPTDCTRTWVPCCLLQWSRPNFHPRSQCVVCWCSMLRVLQRLASMLPLATGDSMARWHCSVSSLDGDVLESRRRRSHANH